MGTKNRNIVHGHTKGIKRILMIGAYKPQVGGVSNVVLNLVKILKTTHKLYVINTEEVGRPVGLAHWKDGRDGSIDVYQERLWYSKKFTTIQTLLQTTKRAWLLRKKIDLYHAHGPFFAGMALLDKKKPLVLTMHGYHTLETLAIGRIKPDSPGFRFMRWMEKKAVKRADAVIAVDKRIKNWIIRDLDGKPEKIFYIPNGVDIERFNPDVDGNPVRKKYGLEQKKVILFFKGFAVKNGPEIIIKAMPEILKNHPDAVLLMCGDGPLKNDLISLTKSLNIETNVLFAGLISNDDAPNYYAASDIVVVPSVHASDVEEATSLTMMEGMATGKPVVVSNIGGLKETMDSGDGRIGVQFNEGDYIDLASKVVELLKQDDTRAEIGEKARDFVVKNRTWKLNAGKVLEVYRYAVEHHKGK